MNRWKEGQRLEEEISTAASNAHWAFKNPNYAKKHYRSGYGTEEYYLNVIIQKAQSRLKQLQKKGKEKKP